MTPASPAHTVEGGRWPVYERMDDPAVSPERLRADLTDLERINRLTGSPQIVCGFLDRLLLRRRARHAGDTTLRILDVATGGADIPRAIVRWAALRRVAVRIVAVDRHPLTARLAAQACAAFPDITIVRAAAPALPFRDGSFDACLCSISLHHLEPDDRPVLLRTLDRLARCGFLIVDLARSPAALAGVWLLTRCFRSPEVRSDGPRSVRRACSWPEYRRLVSQAGIPGLALRRLPGFRVALERL